MQPLTPDDLLPLEEYVGRRAEFFRAHVRYLDRYRRVRLGPRLTLVFENRQTLWFRVQELLRIARLAEPARVRQELDWYNRLLPRRNQLAAALLIDPPDPPEPPDPPGFWATLPDDALRLRLGERAVGPRLVTCRPEDRSIGTAHWLEFTLDPAARSALADFRRPARFTVGHAGYRHEGPALNEEVRQSLVDDLLLSDRDGELAWAA
jgi:hypothetical protein